MAGLKIAVLGAGEMGGRHAEAWTALGHRVVSVTDANRRRAGDLAASCGGARVFGDCAEALRDPEPEVVSLCLPVALHAPVTVLAAEHGKHVLTENPLCRTLEEADRMEAAVRGASSSASASSAIWPRGWICCGAGPPCAHPRIRGRCRQTYPSACEFGAVVDKRPEFRGAQPPRL